MDGHLLTRLDWRFLLPAAPGGVRGHAVLLGGPAGLAGAAREAGLARQVGTELPEGPDADLVAILHGSTVPPEAAVRSLRQGGVLYFESGERRPLASPSRPLHRAVARLRRCGLEVTGAWAVWPVPERWEVCLPLAAPAAVRWFARTLHPAPTARERIIHEGLRLLPGRPAAALLTRFFAFTATAGPALSRPGLLADPGLPPELRQDDLEPVLVTHGRERVLVLPFPRRGSAPAGVLKVSRLPAFNRKTEEEQAGMERVRAALGGSGAETAAALPAARGVVRHGDLAVGIEEYAAGRPLLLTGGRTADLRLAVSWLTELHRRTESARAPWGEQEIAAWIEEPCSAFRRRFGSGREEERLFAAAREWADRLRGLPLPLVLRHRDFTPWNLLRDGRRLRVLDWEGVRPGPPLCDLLHFLTHWGELARRAASPETRLRAFRDTLVAPRPDDPVTAAAARAVADYCGGLRIDRAFVPLLLVHTWMEIALRAVEGAPRGLDAAYVEVLAAHVADLFGRPGDARRAA